PDLRSDPPPQGEGDRTAPASYFAKPSLDDMGPGTDMARPLFRKSEERSAQRSHRSGESIAATNARSESEGPETTLFRKNSLDEMTVGRTEKPVPGKLPQKPKTSAPRAPISPLEGGEERSAKPGNRSSESIAATNAGRTEGGASRSAADAPRPITRARPGAGSYEDPLDQKKKSRTKGKTGRPGR
ncbi:MAG: excinuclease ABC subunit UvrB, partial [Allorhizobium sp.]